MAARTSTPARSLRLKEGKFEYKGTLEQQLEQVEKDLKDLHEKTVIPMRQKRTALRKLKAELRHKIRDAHKTAKEKGSAEAKPAKSQKSAARETKKARLSQPTTSEADWAKRRKTTGNGRRPSTPVTKVKA